MSVVPGCSAHKLPLRPGTQVLLLPLEIEERKMLLLLPTPSPILPWGCWGGGNVPEPEVIRKGDSLGSILPPSIPFGGKYATASIRSSFVSVMGDFRCA